MKFQEKFIGFVDILGFKKLVEAAEDGSGMLLQELMGLLKNLGSYKDVEKFKKYGPTLCPGSAFIQRDLDFKLTQISDCVVVSSEVSPAGAMNLINHCWGAVISLLEKGLMCRGYITKGSVYHTDTQIIGSGYQKAYLKESEVAAFKREADERGTPFVEVDSIVCNYIKGCNDKCISEMFSRLVKSDGEVTALFPFKMLSHSFIIAGLGIEFNPSKEKEANNNMRLFITELKKRILEFVDSSNLAAMKKVEHYIKALDAQLLHCDETDNIIDKFS